MDLYDDLVEENEKAVVAQAVAEAAAEAAKRADAGSAVKLKEALAKTEAVEKENAKLHLKCNLLAKNLCCLYKTAYGQLHHKDAVIKELKNVVRSLRQGHDPGFKLLPGFDETDASMNGTLPAASGQRLLPPPAAPSPASDETRKPRNLETSNTEANRQLKKGADLGVPIKRQDEMPLEAASHPDLAKQPPPKRDRKTMLSADLATAPDQRSEQSPAPPPPPPPPPAPPEQQGTGTPRGSTRGVSAPHAMTHGATPEPQPETIRALEEAQPHGTRPCVRVGTGGAASSPGGTSRTPQRPRQLHRPHPPSEAQPDRKRARVDQGSPCSNKGGEDTRGAPRDRERAWPAPPARCGAAAAGGTVPAAAAGRPAGGSGADSAPRGSGSQAPGRFERDSRGEACGAAGVRGSRNGLRDCRKGLWDAHNGAHEDREGQDRGRDLRQDKEGQDRGRDLRDAGRMGWDGPRDGPVRGRDSINGVRDCRDGLEGRARDLRNGLREGWDGSRKGQPKVRDTHNGIQDGREGHDGPRRVGAHGLPREQASVAPAAAARPGAEAASAPREMQAGGPRAAVRDDLGSGAPPRPLPPPEQSCSRSPLPTNIPQPCVETTMASGGREGAAGGTAARSGHQRQQPEVGGGGSSCGGVVETDIPQKQAHRKHLGSELPTAEVHRDAERAALVPPGAGSVPDACGPPTGAANTSEAMCSGDAQSVCTPSTAAGDSTAGGDPGNSTSIEERPAAGLRGAAQAGQDRGHETAARAAASGPAITGNSGPGAGQECRNASVAERRGGDSGTEQGPAAELRADQHETNACERPDQAAHHACGVEGGAVVGAEDAGLRSCGGVPDVDALPDPCGPLSSQLGSRPSDPVVAVGIVSDTNDAARAAAHNSDNTACPGTKAAHCVSDDAARDRRGALGGPSCPERPRDSPRDECNQDSRQSPVESGCRRPSLQFGPENAAAGGKESASQMRSDPGRACAPQPPPPQREVDRIDQPRRDAATCGSEHAAKEQEGQVSRGVAPNGVHRVQHAAEQRLERPQAGPRRVAPRQPEGARSSSRQPEPRNMVGGERAGDRGREQRGRTEAMRVRSRERGRESPGGRRPATCDDGPRPRLSAAVGGAGGDLRRVDEGQRGGRVSPGRARGARPGSVPKRDDVSGRPRRSVSPGPERDGRGARARDARGDGGCRGAADQPARPQRDRYRSDPGRQPPCRDLPGALDRAGVNSLSDPGQERACRGRQDGERPVGPRREGERLRTANTSREQDLRVGKDRVVAREMERGARDVGLGPVGGRNRHRDGARDVARAEAAAPGDLRGDGKRDRAPAGQPRQHGERNALGGKRESAPAAVDEDLEEGEI